MLVLEETSCDSRLPRDPEELLDAEEDIDDSLVCDCDDEWSLRLKGLRLVLVLLLKKKKSSSHEKGSPEAEEFEGKN